MQRAISFARGPFITRGEIEGYLKAGSTAPARAAPGGARWTISPSPPSRATCARIERDFVMSRLAACRLERLRRGPSMEITRTALHNRMKKLGINSKTAPPGLAETRIRQRRVGPERKSPQAPCRRARLHPRSGDLRCRRQSGMAPLIEWYRAKAGRTPPGRCCRPMGPMFDRADLPAPTTTFSG